jgi:hypothetical protein|tara:strand:+ start:1218 stop:1448 length:231 start_codon:yes stop_codon:yes gene_type:complete
MSETKEIHVNHVEAFEDAISQGVFIDESKPKWSIKARSVHGARRINSWMYMGSNETHHFFKHSFTRENIKAERVEA